MNNKHIITLNIFAIYSLSFFITGHIFGQENNVDDAAILYYQAFLACPDENTFSDEFISFGCGFTDSSPKLLKFNIETNKNLMKLFISATEIRKCNWLIQDRDTRSVIVPQIDVRIPTFVALIGADARYYAINGDYITAFDKCRTLLRFTKHLEFLDDDIFEIYDINTKAFRCIGKILDIMPSDENNLNYIKNLLTEEEKEIQQSCKRIMFDEAGSLMEQASEIDIKKRINEQPIKGPVYEKYKKELLNMDKKSIIKITHQDLNSFLNSFFETIQSDNSYSQKYIKIQELEKDFKQQAENNPAMLWELVDFTQGFHKLYNFNLRFTSRFNALRSAVEIYLVKAKTGQLPKKLPEGLARDPYSGQDFEYILVDDGFKLRCREKDIDTKTFLEFEFKVKDVLGKK